jgi:hypothetical protein
MHKFFFLMMLISTVFMEGCAITKNGAQPIFGTTEPKKVDVDSYVARNIPAESRAPGVKQGLDTLTDDKTPGESSTDKANTSFSKTTFDEQLHAGGPAFMIAIGTTMAATRITDKESEEIFVLVDKVGKAKNKKGLTHDFWMRNVAGNVRVQVTEASLITGTRQIGAVIPKELVEKMNFPSAFNASMFLASADLVSVELFDNRGSWITRILCSEKQPDFKDCLKQYARGRYQVLDGREIDADLKVISNGHRIDLDTFKLIK